MELLLEGHLLSTPEETRRAGALLAPFLIPGDVIALRGDLGAGKTTFVGGVAKALGTRDEVISPTFNIMKCYFNAKPALYHIDAYRLEGQMIDIGLDEAIEGDGVSFIEWPDFIRPLIPEDHLEIEFLHDGESRRMNVRSGGERSRELGLRFKEALHG